MNPHIASASKDTLKFIAGLAAFALVLTLALPSGSTRKRKGLETATPIEPPFPNWVTPQGIESEQWFSYGDRAIVVGKTAEGLAAVLAGRTFDLDFTWAVVVDGVPMAVGQRSTAHGALGDAMRQVDLMSGAA